MREFSQVIILLPQCSPHVCVSDLNWQVHDGVCACYFWGRWLGSPFWVPTARGKKLFRNLVELAWSLRCLLPDLGWGKKSSWETVFVKDEAAFVRDVLCWRQRYPHDIFCCLHRPHCPLQGNAVWRFLTNEIMNVHRYNHWHRQTAKCINYYSIVFQNFSILLAFDRSEYELQQSSCKHWCLF